MLSIIIVNFNTRDLLDKCLSSINSNTSLKDGYEIIVVDNNSKDSSAKMVKTKYPNIILIQNKKNAGFAKANNQGIAKARGNVILLLNSDAYVDKGSIEITYAKLNKEKPVGVLGCKLLNRDNSVQQSAGFSPSLFKVFCWMFFIDDLPLLNKIIKPYHMADQAFYQKAQDVNWVTGAFLMFKKEVIGKAGLLDDCLFMYGEEVEWCYRIRKTGYKIKYIPDVYVYHYKGASGIGSNAGIVEEFSFLKYFFQKHKPSWQAYFLKLFLFGGALLRLLIFGIMVRQPNRAKLYAKVLKMA